MSTQPVVLNPVNLTDDLKSQVEKALSPEAIRFAILAEAEKQTAATLIQTEVDRRTAETAAAAKAEAEKLAAQTQYTRTEIVGGQEMTFEAPTELELERVVNQALRVAAVLQTSQHVEAEPTPSAKELEQQAAEQASRLADLELKFKRGEIGAGQFLEQSGAVDAYLAARGISVPALKETVEQTQLTKETQSWASATQDFLQNSDWPGGDKNLKLIGLQLQAMGLAEAEDKVAALHQAYAALRDQGTLFDGDPVAPTTTAAPTTTTVTHTTTATPTPNPAAVVAARASSGLFGMSSGTAENTVPVTADGKKFDIPADMRPEEILANWNKAQLAAGKDPNAAFTEQFRR